jgi:hypothetical protein
VSKHRAKRATHWLAPVIGLALLGGMTAQQLSYAKPEDVEDYHSKVQQAIDAVPMQIGSWVGSETEIPRSAVELLSPNAILSRQYHNQNTGRSVSLMLVHCRDARDMAGHYPPICYRANGWTQQATQDHNWTLAGDAVPVRSYTFGMDLPANERQMRVMNMLVLPNNTLTREMTRVREVAADYRSHFYGAGQMQVIVDHRMSPSKRRAVFERFYQAVRPAIEAMRAGLTHEQ